MRRPDAPASILTPAERQLLAEHGAELLAS